MAGAPAKESDPAANPKACWVANKERADKAAKRLSCFEFIVMRWARPTQKGET
jgi:hypothetical protein